MLMNQPLLDKLQEFGLGEKESKVYLASLELGEATADQLAKHSGVNRSTTYVQIQDLMSVGLMSTHDKGKKTFFTAESPDNLQRLFERKKQEIDLQSKALEAFVPELMRLHDSAGERPVVRFFEGKEGLTTMRNEVLKLKDTTVYFAFSFDYLWDIYDWDELMYFTETKAKRNITSMVLYNKSGDDIPASPEYKLVGRRLQEKDFPFESDIYIYQNKVAIASTKGNIAGVIIESDAISRSMLSLFQLAWEAAGPLQTTDPASGKPKTGTKSKAK